MTELSSEYGELIGQIIRELIYLRNIKTDKSARDKIILILESTFSFDKKNLETILFILKWLFSSKFPT